MISIGSIYMVISLLVTLPVPLHHILKYNYLNCQMKRSHSIFCLAVWITISICQQSHDTFLFYNGSLLCFVIIPRITFYWMKCFNDRVEWGITKLISGLRISSSFNQCNDGLCIAVEELAIASLLIIIADIQ